MSPTPQKPLPEHLHGSPTPRASWLQTRGPALQVHMSRITVCSPLWLACFTQHELSQNYDASTLLHMLMKGSFFIPVQYFTVNISQSVYSFCCWCTTVFLASMNKAAMNMVVYAFEPARVLTKSWGRKVYVLFLGIYRNLTSFKKWRFFQGPCKTPKF